MYQLYRKYFKHQTEKHPDFLHLDEDGEKVFEVIGIEEAFGDFRTAVQDKRVIFRLINYTFGFSGHDGGDDMQAKVGGFIIAKYNSDRIDGSDGWTAALDACEAYALDFVEKMMADSQNGHPLWNYTLNTPQDLQFNAQPLRATGDGSYAGLLCTFSFGTWFRNCLNQHENDNWKQLTPHDL